ncbi:MAG: CotS family spore coat protein [Clostridium sp.]
MSNVSIDFSNEKIAVECIKTNILPKYGLNNSNVSMVKFKDTDKHRAVFKVEDNHKCYCLKKVYFGEADLLYVYSSIEWLYRKNFNVPKLLPTINKNRFVNFSNMLFILTPWIEGDKCDFDNLKHVLLSSRTLALMHKNSTKFYPIQGSTIRKGYDDLYISTLKHFEQLLTTFNIANDMNDKFSTEFLDNFDDNLLLAELSLSISSQIKESDLSRSLCHGDYVNKNIIFSYDNNIWLIDFDKCKMDYCAHDIAYLLRRILKREGTKWDEDLTLNILKNYNELNPLSESDIRYILSYILFPQKYWKISRDYYKNIKKCNKLAFLTLLKKSNSKLESHLKFASNIIDRIEKEFNIKIRA